MSVRADRFAESFPWKLGDLNECPGQNDRNHPNQTQVDPKFRVLKAGLHPGKLLLQLKIAQLHIRNIT